MNSDPQNYIKELDIHYFVESLRIPSAIIYFPNDDNNFVLPYKNKAYELRFNDWVNEEIPMPSSFISTVDGYLRNKGKKSKPVYAYVEELKHLFRLEISAVAENIYLIIIIESVGSCLLNNSQAETGSGCGCILNRFTEGRIIVDTQGKVLAFNDVAQKYAKEFVKKELTLGLNLSAFAPEDESKSLAINIARALTGESFSIDLKKAADNFDSWIRFSYSSVVDPSNEKPYAVLITFEDVTNLIQSSPATREVDATYKQTLDILGDGYWIWTSSTNELFVSKQVYRQLGFNQNDFSPTVIFFANLLHPSDKARVTKQLYELINGKKKIFESEFRIQSKSGDYIWMLARAGVFFNKDDDKNFQVVGITIDISPQREIQDSLIKGEYRLKKAQEIAHIGSWEEHPEAENCYWSDETYKIFGFTKDSLKHSLAEIIPYTDPKKKDQLVNLLNLVKEKKKDRKLTIPFSYKNPSTEEKYLLIIAEPSTGSADEVPFWHGVVQDISWQKNYERTLKQGKENLMALVTNMPALVFATDNSGNFVFWNRTCEDVTGFKAKEIIGNKDAYKLLYPDYDLRRKIKSQLKDMGIALSTWEHQITTKRGDKRDIVWSAFSEYVKVEGWNSVAIGYDITHQKNNERIQSAYRHQLEALAETAIDFVGMSMEDSIYHYLGTQFEKHLPGNLFIIKSYNPLDDFFTVEGVYGLGVKEWDQALQITGWNPVGRRFQATPEMRSIFSSVKMVKIDQGLYEFSDGLVSSAATRALEKNFLINNIYTIGLTKDYHLFGGVVIITRGENPQADFSIIEGFVNQAAVALDRRQLEMQLLIAKEKAEEADRLKSAFLANMSHEIRTPMNAILGFSQLLTLPNLSKEKRKQYVDIINTKGNSLVKLINDIIDASKVEAGQLTLVNLPCRLNDLLRSMKRFWDKEKVFQKRENINIILNIPDIIEDVEIQVDEGRLEQVFTNLISNALKFTEKGFVEFGYTIEDSTLYFFVKDSGIGVESSQQKIIFDRFRQVEDNVIRTKGGTGLGLAICKGIISLMGGSIWVESSLAKGAEFYFTLPFKPSNLTSTPNQSVEKEVAVEIPDWKNKVLLIAEDEEVNYIFLEELLSSTGVAILWAKDGLQAVELVKTIKKIDAILMDIKMPVMNGYAATMEIRQINSSIPIIAQTAYAFSEDRRKAEAAGCDDYIAKPIDRIELFRILNGFLG